MAKVLVVRISSFGDVAMLVPVVYSVASRYPQDRFYVLTQSNLSSLFDNLNFNVSSISYDGKRKHKGLFGLLKMGRKLVGANFSHVADVHDSLRSKILRLGLTISGSKVKLIDKGREEKNEIIKSKDLSTPLKSNFKRYLEVFEKLGFPADIIFEDLFDFNYKDFSCLMPQVGAKINKWVGVAPFAKHEGKIYPLEKMEKIVAQLSQDSNLTIYLFGAGKKEQNTLAAWATKYVNVKNMAGIFKLEKEILLISYLDVMLTMDSANMHLASLVKTPVVSIWGATHPSLGFYGFNQNPSNAVQVDLECRPCSVYGNIPCSNSEQYACLNRITEESVITKIYKVLENK